MFTQRSALLGFVAFCFYLIAVVNSLSAFYYALTWLSMAMLAASLGVALLSLIGLKCELELTRSRGAAPLGEVAGGGAQVAIAISNVGTLNKTNVVLELRVQDTKKGVQAMRFLVEAVPSGGAIESVLPLSQLRRGTYQLVDARLIGSDVLGLFRRQKKLDFEAGRKREIIIGPPILKSSTALQGGSNGLMAGHQRALMARHGEELRSTRPYAPGDDLRHVHWKSSARAGELVIKEWEQTGQSSALVIWDGAAQTTWGAGDFDSQEWGLILSASLCHALLSGGTPCDFARVDATPLLVEAHTLPGGDLPMELTDALSNADAGRATSLETGLQGLPRWVSRLGSRVLIVSASLSGDLVSGVRFLRARGASVQVFLIDPASLMARQGKRRMRASGTKGSGFKASLQKDGEKSVAISPANFQTQVARVREMGAVVTVVSAREGETAETSLRAALRAAAQTPGFGVDSGTSRGVSAAF